jgi:hypothetical protein
MKKIFLLVLLCFSVFSNDWEFGSEGEHLIPLEASSASIKSEKIVMKLTDKGMQVSVRFVFVSPADEVKKIGFITPPNEPGGELSMSDFKTKVNGREVPSKVEVFDKSPFKTAKTLKTESSAEHGIIGYVYYFDAQFKKGENIVEHSYIYDGSGGIDGRDYEYVITTISKWKNKRVDDFELIIDMGENSFFMLPYTFWKNNKKIGWEIVGEGKITNDKYLYVYDNEAVDTFFVKIKNGYVRYKTKNFSPDFDITIYDIDFFTGRLDLIPEKTEKAEYRDELTYLYGRIYNQNIYVKSEEELKILRNYPYAMAGYDFSNSKLKEYFSRFFWYTPISKDVKVPEDKVSEFVIKTDSILEVRKEIEGYLSKDLKKYSKDELRYIRNLPYALREYSFKDQELQDYYKKKYKWYKPKKYVAVSDMIFTDNEKALIDKTDKILKEK